MSNVVLIVLVCAVVLLFERPVHAYVDPGSGSMFLQLLLGGVAGLGVIIKLYWRRMVGWFSHKSPKEADRQPEAR
jgi:hypothetical protein